MAEAEGPDEPVGSVGNPTGPPSVRVCGARTRAGGRCGRPAMRGQARCDLHGGKSPQALRAAERRLAAEGVARDLDRLGVPVPEGTDPLAVLADALARAAGDLRAIARLVGGLPVEVAAGGGDHGGAHPWFEVYGQTLDRAGRLAKVAADARLDQRRQAVTEAQATALGAAFDRAIGAQGAALPPEQAEALRRALARELRALAEVGASDAA